MSLPSGLLSLASPLGWESEEVPRLGVCCTAWIPKVRIEDFVKGEGERGHTHFVRQHCYENGEYDVHHYQCCCGPEDFSQNVASDSCIASQARKKPREYGDSRKRGCLASFQIMLHHGVSAVRIQCRKADLEHWKNHTNAAGAICHGPDCPHAGKYRAAPGLSKARQPILSAAVTGQTLGQQSKAKMAVARAARKKAAIAAKETGLAQGRLRMPLSDLVVESAAATGRATTSVPFPAAAAPQNWLLQQLETARPATVAVAQVQSGGDFGPGGASLLAAAHVGTTLPQTLASGGTQSTSPPVIKAAAAHGRGHKRERKATRAQQLYEEQENLEF